jgi:hypothetical protein
MFNLDDAESQCDPINSFGSRVGTLMRIGL